jgi:hypothetical protein
MAPGSGPLLWPSDGREVVGRSPRLGVVEEQFPLVPATESAAAGAGLVLGPALAAAAAAAEEEPRDHPEVDGERRLRPAEVELAASVVVPRPKLRPRWRSAA